MKFCYLLLALAIALPLLASAQTPLGQPSLDESKVQIWCATIRYVYDDGGHPALKSTVRCEPGSLGTLEASILPDSLRVHSLLFVPVEAKINAQSGEVDNPTRLQALVKAIIKKLKSSPARRRDPARMQRLEALEKALTDYATHGTPPGDVAAAMLPEAPDTSATAAGNAAPGPAEAAEAQAAETALADSERQASSTQSPAPGSAQDLLTRFAAPLALILSILALVVFAVQRISMARWSRQQRRETLAARQAAAASQAAVAATQATVADTAARLQRAEALVRAAHETPGVAAAPAAESLTDGQRREVERLVSQRVDEELRWLRAQLPELVATAVANPKTDDLRPNPAGE